MVEFRNVKYYAREDTDGSWLPDAKGSIGIFDDINEVCYFCERGEVNHAVFDDHMASERQRSNNNAWSMSGSLEEAIALARAGWDEGYTQMIEADKFKDIIELFKPMMVKRKFVPINDLIGHTPDVARMLMNHPLSMNSDLRTRDKRRNINIVIDITASSYVRSDRMLSRGILICNLINVIEEAGIRATVYIAMTGSVKGEVMATFIKVKHTNEALNTRRLAYPIAHPSMLRRILFRLIEIRGSTDEWVPGYGRPNSKIATDYLNHKSDDFRNILFFPENLTLEYDMTEPKKYVEECIKFSQKAFGDNCAFSKPPQEERTV
jgi:hypothetical protein